MWIIHSLKKRYIDVLHYVKKENPAIICLQEVLSGHDSFNIRGFTKYTHDTTRGLITYINNKLPHELIENSINLDNNEGNTYMLFKIDIRGKSFLYM